MAGEESHSPGKPESPSEAVSLEDLARAFAEATGQRPPAEQPPEKGDGAGRNAPPESSPSASAAESQQEPSALSRAEDTGADFPVTPKTILEALLFVGHPQNRPLSPGQVAEVMRGVEAGELAHLVGELNQQYLESGRPYRIAFEDGGYRMRLLPEYDSLREGFFGKVRPVRLSQQALEVLAIVAYKQPITVKEVNQLRGRPSGSLLAQLVRRNLIEVVTRESEGKRVAQYRTTQRLLEVFGLQSLDDLPQLGETSFVSVVFESEPPPADGPSQTASGSGKSEADRPSGSPD